MIKTLAQVSSNHCTMYSQFCVHLFKCSLFISNFQDPNSPTDEDFRKMEQKIHQLTTELQKKDRTLKQLNELFPWKNKISKGGNAEQDGYLCSLSDDEYIV